MGFVSLSFDNGPHPDVTPSVLETLSTYGLLATFFVVGKNISSGQGRSLVAEAHARGHWIGNHTFSHSVPLGRIADPLAAIAEIERTQELIGAFAHPRRFFRPYGEGGVLDDRLLGPSAAGYLLAQRYSCVTWNAVPRDWSDPSGWVDTALEQVRRQQHSLVVLHDIATGAMTRLAEFIERTLAMGLQYRQSFPEECLLIDQGEAKSSLDRYVAAPPGDDRH